MKNVTEIQVLGNDTVAFYNGTDIIMNVSQVIPNTSVYMTYGNNSITLILPSTTPFTFSVLPVTQIGPVTYTPLTGVEPQDQITARVLEIYTQLASTIFKGCCDCGSGTGGCTIEYQYNSDLSTGQWFYDSGTGKLQFNETSYLGQNFAGFYPVLPNNSWVFLVSDADPTIYAIFQVANYANMGTYIEYDATLIDGSTTFVVNTVFCVSLAAAGGSAIVTIAAGNAGVSVTGSYPSFTISNDMTLTAGTNVTITGTYPNYIINSTGGGGGGSGTVTSIDVDGGTGISVSPAGPITTSGTFTVTNTAPDQVVSLTDGTGISTSGTYPNFTITNTAPDQIVSLTAGTGISVSGTYPSFTIDSTVTGGVPHATASGTDTYTATIAGVTSYNDGDAYLIRFTNGNTNAATLNINGLGAVSLYRNNDGALIGGDIWDGGEMICVYNSTTLAFQCIGTSPNSLFSYVTNDDSVTITKGQPVYAFSGTGNRMTVKLAYNTTDATSAQTVGIVYSTSIAPNQKGFIMMQGLLDGLSTLPTSTWTDGDTVYLGATAGTITPTKPYAPNHLVYLGVVTTASPGSAGRMYVRVQNGYELSEIHDVDLVSTPPVNNDVLTYITGSPNLWKPRSLSTILGYTPQAQLSGTGFVKATGTTISYDNSTYTPTSRTLTIDGTSYDLSADRSWTTGGNYSAYTMKANNTASTAAPANFTFKDLGDQALPTSPTWNGTAPSGTVNNRYRWFQIGNVVHYHFSFTYTTAGTGNTTLSFTHPSDMPVPVAFTGVPGAVAAPYFLYRALSYAAATLNTQPPIGWYGGLKVNSTGPTVYGWAFSGTSLSLTNWSVHGTYYT